MNFNFITANQIVFGQDTIQQLPQYAAPFGKNIVLVLGSNATRHQAILDLLHEAGHHVVVFQVEKEPTMATIQAGVEQARAAQAHQVIAVGGGSVIDAAKAIAAITPHSGELLDYLEVVGHGKPLSNDPLPMIAIPTTAGTGAEVTKNAVIAVEEKQVKVSLRDNRMLPNVALLDPTLTLTAPPHITATTGLDALTQVIEPYVSRFANPFTDLFCAEGIQRGATHLRTAYQQPNDIEARENMMYVSLLGGLALANAKLGAVHGFAGVLGGVTGAAHGAICGTLLPHVMTANIAALRQNNPADTLQRYHQIAQWLTGNPNAEAEDGVAWVRELVIDLEIPSLGALGLHTEAIPDVVKQSQQSSSMKGNPMTLEAKTLEQILTDAL